VYLDDHNSEIQTESLNNNSADQMTLCANAFKMALYGNDIDVLLPITLPVSDLTSVSNSRMEISYQQIESDFISNTIKFNFSIDVDSNNDTNAEKYNILTNTMNINLTKGKFYNDIQFLDNNNDNNTNNLTVSDSKYIFNNEPYILDIKIGLKTGQYTLNIPTAHPIGFEFTNSGHVNVTGTNVHSTDANGVTYYTGDINLEVVGDFGTASYKCALHDYMGGENRLVYFDPNEDKKGGIKYNTSKNSYLSVSEPNDSSLFDYKRYDFNYQDLNNKLNIIPQDTGGYSDDQSILQNNINQIWFRQGISIESELDIEIAKLTLSNDAEGTLIYTYADTSQDKLYHREELYIENGRIKLSNPYVVIHGVVLVGYVRDAQVDINDVITNTTIKSITTDYLGKYVTTLPLMDIPETFEIVVAPGGVDIASRSNVTITLKAVFTRAEVLSNKQLHVTPLTTLVALMTKEDGFTITKARERVASVFNISVADIEKDHIAEENVVLTKAVQQLDVIASTLAVMASSIDADDVMASISTAITNKADFNITDSVAEVVSQLEQDANITETTKTNATALAQSMTTAIEAIASTYSFTEVITQATQLTEATKTEVEKVDFNFNDTNLDTDTVIETIGTASGSIDVGNVLGLDDVPPIIALDGDDYVVVRKGGTFTEDGVNASDNVDGNDVQISIDYGGLIIDPETNEVLSDANDYNVIYTAIDLSGNEASVSRSVTVLSVPIVTENDIMVKYVRFERIDNTLPTWDLELNVREMYVYNTDGVNIGANGTPSGLNESTVDFYAIHYLNNSDLGGNDSKFALSSGGDNRGATPNTTRNWLQIELADEVSLSDIQKVLVYNRSVTGNTGINSRPAGCVIQLRDANGNIIVQSNKLTSTTTSLVAYYQDGATPHSGYVSLGTFEPDNIPRIRKIPQATIQVGVQTVEGNNKYTFGGNEYNSNTQIGVTYGTYKFNIPAEHPMGFEFSNPTHVNVTGDSVNSTDDNDVTYYTGTVTLEVVGDFGTASYKCANHGYMGGQNNLQFESLFAFGLGNVTGYYMWNGGNAVAKDQIEYVKIPKENVHIFMANGDGINWNDGRSAYRVTPWTSRDEGNKRNFMLWNHGYDGSTSLPITRGYYIQLYVEANQITITEAVSGIIDTNHVLEYFITSFLENVGTGDFGFTESVDYDLYFILENKVPDTPEEAVSFPGPAYGNESSYYNKLLPEDKQYGHFQGFRDLREPRTYRIDRPYVTQIQNFYSSSSKYNAKYILRGYFKPKTTGMHKFSKSGTASLLGFMMNVWAMGYSDHGRNWTQLSGSSLQPMYLKNTEVYPIRMVVSGGANQYINMFFQEPDPTIATGFSATMTDFTEYLHWTPYDQVFCKVQSLTQKDAIQVGVEAEYEGGENKYTFDGNTYNSNTQIGVTYGTYTLNIPAAHPMGFEFSNSEHVNVTGANVHSTDDNGVTYYTGNVTLEVKADFGTASYKCALDGYMGGQNNLKFESLFAPEPLTVVLINGYVKNEIGKLYMKDDANSDTWVLKESFRSDDKGRAILLTKKRDIKGKLCKVVTDGEGEGIDITLESSDIDTNVSDEFVNLPMENVFEGNEVEDGETINVTPLTTLKSELYKKYKGNDVDNKNDTELLDESKTLIYETFLKEDNDVNDDITQKKKYIDKDYVNTSDDVVDITRSRKVMIVANKISMIDTIFKEETDTDNKDGFAKDDIIKAISKNVYNKRSSTSSKFLLNDNDIGVLYDTLANEDSTMNKFNHGTSENTEEDILKENIKKGLFDTFTQFNTIIEDSNTDDISEINKSIKRARKKTREIYKQHKEDTSNTGYLPTIQFDSIVATYTSKSKSLHWMDYKSNMKTNIKSSSVPPESFQMNHLFSYQTNSNYIKSDKSVICNRDASMVTFSKRIFTSGKYDK
jgi:hypothetical protein